MAAARRSNRLDSEEVLDALVNAYANYNNTTTPQDCVDPLLETTPVVEPEPLQGPQCGGKNTRLVGRHFMERIPSSGKKEKVARVCKVCADISKKRTGKRVRKETIFYCPDCNVPLCYYPCFKLYHTREDYTE